MNLESARNNMLSQQLRTNNIVNPTVLELITNVPREEFVPQAYRDVAFSDMRIPLAYKQTMMTPLEEATVLQALTLTKNMTVLEIGTGTGYLTACLAKLAKQVVSVEYYADFTREAEKKLAVYGIDNVTLINGDGYRGNMEHAPYDAIVMTGAIPKLDNCYRPQLMQGGKMIAIIGQSPVMDACLFTLDDKDQWHTSFLFDTSLPPLINRLAKPTFSF